MSQAVLLEKKGLVAEIILNKPEELNAMNPELIEALAQAVQACNAPEIKAVVLSAKGRCFCAGGDIKFFNQRIQNKEAIPKSMVDRLHEMIESLRNLEKPVLASVQGAAAGAGAPLVLACDLAIASEETVFNLAYARIGLTPDGSSTYFLPKHVGMKKAAEIFMMMPNLSAQEAKELGLINWIVPLEELKVKTEEIALQLAQGPTQVFGRLKKLLQGSYTNTLHEQLSLETKNICESSLTDHFKEGVESFLEKRPPRFLDL
ncbi:MAG: enoyl-CoA hydratase/isomerase family protein [Deltaproteobacteria bacterium]|nr:enoyl-CoA hydratase/isomerase family protein [Deltaproteobacteria bacterium]